MEKKWMVKWRFMNMTFYITSEGWSTCSHNEEKTLFTEDEANVVLNTLSCIMQGSDISSEQVSRFKYLKDDAVYSPKKHYTEYLKPEVAEKFATNVQDVMGLNSTNDTLNMFKYQCLSFAFDWENTPEGEDYWLGVSKELDKLKESL